MSELASGRAAEFLAAAPGLQITAAGARLPGGLLAARRGQRSSGRRPRNRQRSCARWSLLTAGASRASSARSASSRRRRCGWPWPHLARRRGPGRLGTPAVLGLHAPLAGFRARTECIRTPAFDPALLVSELGATRTVSRCCPGRAASGRRCSPTAATARPMSRPWFARRAGADRAPGLRVALRAGVQGRSRRARRRYTMVLFASRRLARDPAADARDAVEAVRAAGEYPALAAVLERAGSTTSRRSRAPRAGPTPCRGSPIAGVRHAPSPSIRGALALVTRAASRRSLAAGPVTAASHHRSQKFPSAAAASTKAGSRTWLGTGWPRRPKPGHRAPAGRAARGTLRGRLQRRAQPIEQTDGNVSWPVPRPSSPRFVEWEGTRYRLDLACGGGVAIRESPWTPSEPVAVLGRGSGGHGGRARRFRA